MDAHTFETSDSEGFITDVTEVSDPTVYQFREYVGTCDQEGSVARWFHNDVCLAEAGESFGFLVHGDVL